MDKQDPKELLNNMLQAAGVGDPKIITDLSGDQQTKSVEMLLEPLAMALQHVEMGLMQIAQGQQTMGTILDTSRLAVHLLVNVLIDKGIFTREEWEAQYEVEVVQKMQEYQKKIQEKIQQQIQAQVDADSKNNLSAEPPAQLEAPIEEPEEDPDTKSDVVLPSELHSGIKKF